MLQIVIPAIEQFDELKQEFIYSEEQTLQLEHSLVSLSTWESKWCKPFLSKEPKTTEETFDYIKCMTLNKDVDPNVYLNLTDDNITQVNKYIEAPMTATTFNEEKAPKGGREIITAELIYYWMISLQIPFECQYWHLNRLLTLVKVCNIKNTPPKKMGKRALMNRNSALNAQRKAQMNTKG